jgi:hypothetical protein
MCGYATARTALIPIAASTALPPFRRMSTPVLLASECGVATIAFVARVGGRPIAVVSYID